MSRILPRVFIGSSGEARPIAQAIRENLSEDAYVVVWTEGFPPGKAFIDALLDQANDTDFAILVVTPDDVTESRGHQSLSPRDNVVFELGLFTGKLGVDRCYSVHPDEVDVKFPSDLLGINTVRYRPEHPNGLASALGAACDKIRRRIQELGVRAQDLDARSFCSRILGFWWEYITPVNISSLGFLEIVAEGSSNIHIRGESHRADGSRAADWWTDGCAINPRERKLFYIWKGRYIDAPDRLFEGFGDFSFNDASDQFVRGHGFFAEMDATDLRKTRKRAGKLARCSQSDVQIMHSGNKHRIKELILNKLTSD